MLIAALLVALSLTACGDDATDGDGGAAEPTVVRFAAPAPVAAAWPTYVAQDQGYFEQRNLDVEISYVGGGQGPQRLAGGEIDLFLTNPDQPASAINKNAPIVGVAGALDTPFALLVGPGIETYEDLQGEKLGVAVASGADSAILQAMLRENGLEEGDVEVVQGGSGGNLIAALESAAIVGLVMPQPYDLQYLDANPKAGELGYQDDFFDAQITAQFANRDWAESHREALTAFLAAQLEAREWLMDSANESQAVKLLANETEVSPEIATRTYELVAERGLFDRAIEVDPQGVDAFLAVAEEVGGGPFEEAATYFDLSYLEAAEEG